MSEEQQIVKRYSNGEVTIVWKPRLCIHSGNCVRGLPSVFDTSARPWIDADGASTKEIIAQVKRCPSGALSYELENEDYEEEEPADEESRLVEVSKNGPLMVHGDLLVRNHNGNETRKQKITAFCRCGKSSNKPFCDGTHKSGFEG